MKKTKRLCALLLALVMLISCMCTTAFAGTEDNVQQYDSMLVLGSSISRGCGLGGGYGDYSNTEYLSGLEGSYPSIVADKCGVPKENRYFCTIQGQTLASVLSVLGLDSVADDPLCTGDYLYARAYYPFIRECFGEGGAYQLGGENGRIANSDLIVVELGMSDIFYRSKELSYLEQAFDGGGYDMTEVVSTLLKEVYNGYRYVINHYAKLLDYIKAYNPDAEVVLVSFFNMFGGVTLTDDTLLPVGDACAAITASINQYLKALAAKYDYEFADITNVGTPASEQNMSITGEDFRSDMNLNVHPSIENGLPYIARQVISVLPEITPVEKNPYDICIDMNHIKKVNRVLVNKKNVTDYTLRGSVLTIPYTNSKASVVTVTSVGENGKVAVQVYQLAYHDGYVPYRIYGTSDAGGIVKKAINNIIALTKKAFSTLRGLFA